MNLRIDQPASICRATIKSRIEELAILGGRAGFTEPLHVGRPNVVGKARIMSRISQILDRAWLTNDGEVLQVKVRAGEYAPAAAMQNPLMLIGSVETLQLRVDIDENDAWRVRPGAAAKASLRGNSSISTGLTFLRFEPYIVPKRSLTGESTERVDTRVLQILFSFPRGTIPVYVGQLMDVFIEAPEGVSTKGIE